MTKPTRSPVAQTGPTPTLSPELKGKVATWKQLREWLEEARKRELELRKELASILVPNPKEGTNTIDGQGFRVVMVRKVNRRLDKTTLDAIMYQMPEDAQVVGTLIRYEPTFDLAYYRNLSPEARKTFEQTLEITDGAPELEIVLSEDEATKTFTESSSGISHVERPANVGAGAVVLGDTATKEKAQKAGMAVRESTQWEGKKNPTLARTTSKKSAHKPTPKPITTKSAAKKSKRGKK